MIKKCAGHVLRAQSNDQAALVVKDYLPEYRFAWQAAGQLFVKCHARTLSCYTAKRVLAHFHLNFAIVFATGVAVAAQHPWRLKSSGRTLSARRRRMDVRLWLLSFWFLLHSKEDARFRRSVTTHFGTRGGVVCTPLPQTFKVTAGLPIVKANSMIRFAKGSLHGMVITIKEIQDYWSRYCERHGLKPKIVTEGMRQIKLNPDYWADHTMAELTEVAASKVERPKTKPRSALLRRGIA